MAQYSSERARAVVRWLMGQTGKKQEEIGRELGFQKKASFSAVLTGKVKVPQRLPTDLAALDPRINVDYLTGKSDEMLLPSGSAPGGDVVLSGAAMKLLTDMMATIRSQQETIRLQQETILRGATLQKKPGDAI